MCGICGQYNFTDQEPVSIRTIETMTDVIRHRGPDDVGYFLSGPLGFGFRRLSIIDLQGGRQPMSDPERKIWIVFNGEIYNFRELRSELEGFGHVFRTRSDTEAIIHGYKHWGDEVFNHLNGMFGLAIWDEEKRKLIIARDPMGIKFVYYKVENERLYFGSEIRAILAASDGKHEIDPVALNLFLRYRYTPSPLTLFKGIFKLAPGTMATFSNGRMQVTRWYRFRPTLFSRKLSDFQAKGELLELYKSALKRHLVSDVPLGLLLSGGIDSGLLLALMNLYGKQWRTYTVGYGESFRDDELRDAAKTSSVLSSNHVPVQIDRSTFEKNLPQIIHHLEEPVATSSIVPMYFVCQRARQDVKVVLMGQGPDELFGGYPRHLGVHYGNYWRNIPGFMRALITSTVEAIPRNETLKRGVYSLNVAEKMKRYQYVFSIMPGDLIDSLFQNDLLPPGAGDKVLEYWEDILDVMDGTDELGGFQFLEMRSSLPDELLLYADKLSMAHGLEVRVPYLDREVVEYAERLPAHFKIRYGSRKWLHRQICKDILPKDIVNRKKRGFAVNVVDDWFRESMSRGMDDILLDSNSLMYKWLRNDSIASFLKKHRNGEKDFHKILFSLIVFEVWLRSV